MKLLVDIGNSCVKWATLTTETLSPQQSVAYRQITLYQTLTQMWQNLTTPEGIWIANVAGQACAEIMVQWTTVHWTMQPVFVTTTQQACGVTNGYEYPERLGVDRWVALIGAHALIKGELCVIDCGTAATLDVIAENGQHLGGLIMPGLHTMQQTLLNNTHALLYLTQIEQCQNNQALLAHNTHTGISLGIVYAIVGWLEYVIQKLEQQGHSITLILTGGCVATLLPFLHRPYQHIPDLVLQGLVVMVNKQL